MTVSTLESTYRLSPMQQGMLFHNLYAPQSGVFIQQVIGTLREPLDTGAFSAAWQRVIDRHPMLRTSFHWEGLDEPVQGAREAVALPVEQHDWSGLTAAEQEYRLEVFLKADRRRGFELGEAPLMRVAIFRLGTAHFQFIWTSHHALLDNRSRFLVLKEVFSYYDVLQRGEDVELDLPRPFSEYVEWLRAQDAASAEAFWRAELAGFSAPTPLVVGRMPGALLDSEADYGAQEVRVGAAATAELVGLAGRIGVPVPTLLRGAWALLLSRYSGDTDVLFGEARSCGRDAVPDADSMIGLFLNTIPVRARLEPATPLGDWLQQLHAQQRAAQPYEHTPLARTQEWSGVPRGLPLFESIVFVDDDLTSRALREGVSGRWGHQEFRFVEQTNYPLAARASFDPDLLLTISYDRRRFDDTAISRMLGHLGEVLTAMPSSLDRPLSAVPLLTAAEREQLLFHWNDTAAEYEDNRCIHEIIATQAARRPTAVALAFEDDEITYAELDRRSNQLATRLRQLGVGPEVLVGLCTERSIDMVVGVLGILKAGAAYVPVDPKYPAERIGFVLGDARVAVLVTQQELVGRIPTGDVPLVCLDDAAMRALPSEPVRDSGVGPDNLAYVIYTSGSTGKPKGVMISHAALTHYVQAIRAPLGVTEADRYLHTASIAFSSSVRQLMVPLSLGATVEIASAARIGNPISLFELIKRREVSIIDLVPSYWQNCIHALEALEPRERATLLDNRLRLVLAASEPLPCDVPARWSFGLRHPARLINMCGQTETAGIATVFPIPAGHDHGVTVVRVGRPIANTRAYVLDEHGQPVPVGVAGELCIGGRALARGYLNRPDLTAEKFVADPFSTERGSRMYRTGDRARFAADGTLEFLGRADNQVKIRGFRVEVEEVEAALLSHPGVSAAVITAQADAAGDRRLIAYFVGAAGKQAASLEELRSHLKAKLPDYMVPAAFVRLDAIPRTPNGKVDRAALPAPDLSRLEVTNSFVAPRTPMEEIVAAIWADVLGVDRVGIDDNFFELGGHSLMGIRVLSRMRDRLQVDLPLRRLFDVPTVRGLAAAAEGTGASAPAMPPLTRLDGDDASLSFSQERLWVMTQIEPDSAAYNLSAAIRMTGALHQDAMRRALTEIVRRHEALRTVFPSVDGTARQVISAPAPVELPVTDLEGLAPEAREAAATAMAAREVARPFDLATGPLFRAALIRLQDDEHLLVLTMHHIVSDGWSRGVLYREVGALYEAFAAGRESPLPELPIQYRDFARWQRTWLEDSVLEGQVAYWKNALGGTLPKLDLPTDRPRPQLQSSRGATRSFPLPEALCAELRALSKREEVTMFMTLLAAFQAVLARYSGQQDIIVGSPTAGRTRSETENLIGFFVNTLALRTDLSGDPTFRELLARVREVSLGAYANQDLPFERVVESLHLERDLSRTPLFQVMFILQNTPAHPLELTDLTLRQLDVDAGAAKFDITLSLVAASGGYTGYLEYNTDLYDAATIDRLAAHFTTLLEGAAAQPELPVSRLPMLTRAERRQILEVWNDTAVEFPADRTIHELFEEQVRRTPDAPALVFGSARLTYRELNARANALAHHLRTLGVGADTIVGVFAERSLELMVGLIAVQKAGGAYLPLDPAYPRDRVAFMLEDAGVPVLLTQRRLMNRLPAHAARVVDLEAGWGTAADAPVSDPAAVAKPDNLAYVIYTSGSTGKPKGVMVQHRNVVNFFTGMDARIGTERGTWLAVTSISFDISVLELFWTLTRGFEVIIQREEDRARPRSGTRGSASTRKIDFSLFYFASNESEADASQKYRLLMEGAKFADQNGFHAVWTPERHFHAFGGLYPSPAVASAAIAACTEHVQIRSGSVVLPLHNPIRVAEDWSVVDNISRGRVGLAFASGWHDRDFVFAPDNYARRRELMYEQIEQVRTLWRGGSITAKSGAGKDVSISILPRPVQADLPIWITAAGTVETFQTAGRIGANLLTHLLGQTVEQVSAKIAAYRAARREAGHEGEGQVTLMMHTFVGDDMDYVREQVRGPFREYLRTSVDLIKGLAEGRGQDMRASSFTAEDMEALLDHAFNRYFETSALMGTPETCLEMIDTLKEIGVDEVACLIDFGVDFDATIGSLRHLADLKERAQPVEVDAEDYTIPRQLERHRVTHMQCTPSMASMLTAQDEGRQALRSLRRLMIGGEAFPASLAAELASVVTGDIINMYGPTETTIWSSTHPVTATEATIPIGTPIANTDLLVLDGVRQLVPAGVAGELYIGGAGVVRGYLHRPELTAERFVPHPFRAGERLYRTGDLARFRADGVVEFLGRVDHQVKIRGHRIELGEIEALLAAQPAVREGVVIAREDVAGDKRLVAYVVAQPGETVAPADLRQALATALPEYMVPSHVVVLDAMPRTPNLKIDRKALPAPDVLAGAPAAERAFVPPSSDFERTLASIWCEVLRVPEVGTRDNFFDLGGHSLLVVKVHARLRNETGRVVSITDLFRFPTIESLAAHLGGGGDQRSVVEESYDRADSRKQAMMRRRQRRQDA